MSRNLSHHDSFVRKLFSNKRMAVDYFKTYLPDSVSRLLDFRSLKREPDTYMDDDLNRSMADIIFSCERKDGKGSVKICLLIEHKSYLYIYSPVQLGKYIFLAMDAQLKAGEPLSLIVPILLYHGKERWEYGTLGDLYKNLEDELKTYLPDFNYIFHDLGELSDSEIEALHNKFLAASILVLKFAFDKGELEQNAVRILLLSQYGTKGLQRSLIRYLFSRSKLRDEMLESLPDNIKSDVMNTLEIYVEKGRKEGLEKGEKLGLEKGQIIVITNLIKNTDWNDHKISDMTGVSIDLVRQVRSSLEK